MKLGMLGIWLKSGVRDMHIHSPLPHPLDFREGWRILMWGLEFFKYFLIFYILSINRVNNVIQ